MQTKNPKQITYFNGKLYETTYRKLSEIEFAEIKKKHPSPTTSKYTEIDSKITVMSRKKWEVFKNKLSSDWRLSYSQGNK